MTRADTVLVCGDFGLWHDDKEERGKLDWLASKQFTIAFVDGNHENYDRLNSDEFPVVDFHGGKAQQIRENLYHLLRGEIYELDGKSFFAFGGAKSHDTQDGILDPADYPEENQLRRVMRQWDRAGKMFRVRHLSWWDEEMPSEDEMDAGLRNLDKHGNRVDYIISHCCPQSVASMLGFRDGDRLTQYFNRIDQTVEYSKWYFGHYHANLAVLDKYILLYEMIERIL